MVRNQLRFLKRTTCADESLWGTIAGNPELLPMPGGFHAKDFLVRKYGGTVANWRSMHQSPWTAPPISSGNATPSGLIDSYAISRYQQWMINTNSLCR
ncbi:hypothetical protein GCK32_016147, partial [Trichostrongylus colubriformis]